MGRLLGNVMRILAAYAVLSLPPTIYIGHDLAMTWCGYVTLYTMIVGLISAVGVFAYLFFEQGVRPVVRESLACGLRRARSCRSRKDALPDTGDHLLHRDRGRFDLPRSWTNRRHTAVSSSD